jgi:hypothetical protein
MISPTSTGVDPIDNVVPLPCCASDPVYGILCSFPNRQSGRV